METACIYARFSSSAQSDGYSIEGQLFACKEFAERNGYTITKHYIDEAKTGTSDKRDSFQEMMDDARSIEKPFDYILINDYARFSRNRQDQINYKQELRFLGINVISITQPIDHDSPDSVLLESLHEGMAEQYSRKLSRDVKRGMVEAAKRGHWTGGPPPIGYKLKPIENGKNKLVVDPENAPIPKRIFKLYASEKYGFKNIVKLINKEFPDCKNNFTSQDIKNVLKNQRYIGSMVWGKKGNAKKKFLSPNEKTVEIKNSHPALITTKTFNKVQKILEGRKKRILKKPSKHLLNGIMKCGNCGSAVIGCPAKGNKYTYYTCTNRRNRNTCDMRTINSNIIEPQIINYLKKHFMSDQYIERIFLKLEKAEHSKKKGIEDSSIRYLKKLESLEKRKAKLLLLVENTDVDMSDISERIKQLNEEIADSKTQIRICDEKKKIIKDSYKITKKSDVSTFQETIQYLISSVISNELINRVMRTITLKEESIIVELHLSEDFTGLGTKVLKEGDVVGYTTPFTNPGYDKNPFVDLYNSMEIKKTIKV